MSCGKVISPTFDETIKIRCGNTSLTGEPYLCDECEKIKYPPCCDNEERAFEGGCKNCGDPSF